VSREAIFQALVIAALLGLVKFVRDVTILKAQVEPLIEWWKQTALDALRIATNPTSRRLTELADKYIACVTGKGKMSPAEKEELIDGLREVMNDKDANKRQSASISLRFIEAQEKIPMKWKRNQ
jgi:hypothetical protein